jgi:ankyrin repeat protein
VDLLLAKGADVNLRNQNGATALAWATRGGFDAIEKSLVKRGAIP